MFKGSAAPSSYTINDLGGMALWLDAANYNESTGVWLDKGGKFNHAGDNGVGVLPTKLIADINGQSALSFNGTDTHISTLFETNFIPNGSFFIVADNKETNTSAIRHLFCSNTISTARTFLQTAKFNGSSTIGQPIVDAIPYNSGYHLYELQVTPTSAIVGFDGVYGAATSHAVSTFPLSRIGARAGTTDPFKGSIAEIIVFTKVQSSAERAIVINYLNNKYAQSWP